nr:pyroglutamyl-peptidase I [Leptotrichia sp. oral taxon 212]
MMKILVTGFDPFGGEPINPAIESVKRLPDNIAGAEIIKLEIPTVRKKSLEKIEKAINEHNPDVILSIGQAGGRFDISIERVGINLDDFRIPDNEGNQIIDEPIFPDGENSYFVKLPVKAMVQNVQKNNIPASVSYTAGTFVCNHVLYGVLYLIEKKYKGKKSGFIHIPFLPQQVVDKRNMPSMELNTIVKGLTAAIEAIVKNNEDIKEVGGTVC